jgi:hypothetical protein
MFMFIMTNVIFSGIIAFGLIQYNSKKNISNLKIFLFSLGLGPAFTSIILYWFLFLFPYKSDVFYFVAVLLFYFLILLIILFHKKLDWSKNLINLKKPFYLIKQLIFLIKKNNKKAFFIVIIIIGSVLSIYPTFIQYSKVYLLKPLVGHDAQSYGTEGKIYYKEKTFKHRYSGEYPESGYISFSQHSPLFPLLLTWEKITGSMVGKDTDYYFKSITPFYGLLIVIFVFSVLSIKSVYLAVLGSAALFSSSVFFSKFFSYHIDLFRIFFFSTAIIFLASSIETKDRLQIILFCVTSGFSAASHSIGAIVFAFSGLIFFLFYEDEMINRIKYFLFITFSVFILGGFHYFYDTIWGTGWIF